MVITVHRDYFAFDHKKKLNEIELPKHKKKARICINPKTISIGSGRGTVFM